MADAIIEIFSGNIGSGKSYTAVERIFTQLCQGGHVYTNIRIVKDAAILAAESCGLQISFDAQYHFLTNEQVADFPKHISGSSSSVNVLVVIDEAHLYFNARDWKKTSASIVAFISQTRKYSVNIIAITQHELNLDTQFRRFAQYIWFHVDLSKVYIPFLGLRMDFLKMTQAVCFDPVNHKVRHITKNYTRRPLIYSLYASEALLVETDVTTRVDIIKPKPLPWRNRWRAKLQILGISPKTACWLIN